MKRHLEDDLQSACITWFDYQFPKLKNLLFHVPNGGNRNIREAARLKKQGVRSGVSDLILLVPNNEYHGLCIELKSYQGKLSINQSNWIELVRKNNYCAIVVNSFEAFKFVIENYLIQ